MATKIEVPEKGNTDLERIEPVTDSILSIINAGADREVTMRALEVFQFSVQTRYSATEVRVNEQH